MAANLFGRYVWLIDILRRYKRLTFQEINELWQESSLGYGDELPLRTFHNHQKAIKDIFDVYIDCDRKDGYRYYIDEPERLEGAPSSGAQRHSHPLSGPPAAGDRRKSAHV